MTGSGTQEDPFVIANWTDFINAVGTTDAYVEFPKNLVRTTDTVVNPNKLYVDSDGVVQRNVQNSDLPNLFENTFALDGNSYAPTGFATTITVNCKRLNGCGGTIKNLKNNNGTADGFSIFSSTSYGANIRAIAFLNIYLINRTWFFKMTQYNGFNSCIFTGKMTNLVEGNVYSKFIGYDGTNANYTIWCCSGYLELIGKVIPFNETVDSYTTWGTSLESSRFTFILSGDRTSKAVYMRLVDSCITGKFSSRYLVMTSQSADSIVDIVHPTNMSVLTSVISNIVINTGTNNDKYSGSAPTGCKLVNDTQLKDASYLASIGFPIET